MPAPSSTTKRVGQHISHPSPLTPHLIAQAGGNIKYGHSEVGNFVLDGRVYEQNEIEFLPVEAERAADQLTIAKWVIRNLAYQMGLNVTFAPKITTGKAGSGLHIHMRMMKDGQNRMLRDGQLSDDARRMIAGLCVACRHGFEMENALQVAQHTYVNVNIHDKANADKLAELQQLPDSCVASAECLLRQRRVYEEYGVFSPAMIDGIIASLRAFDDRTLRVDIQQSQEEIGKLVDRYFHCG